MLCPCLTTVPAADSSGTNANQACPRGCGHLASHAIASLHLPSSRHTGEHAVLTPFASVHMVVLLGVPGRFVKRFSACEYSQSASTPKTVSMQ